MSLKPTLTALGQIHAVVIFSDRPRHLADWYKQAVAVREVVTSDDFIGLQAAGVTLFIQRTSEGHRPGLGGVRPHFSVDSCEQAFRQLIEAGAREVLAVVNTGGEWVAAVADPEGNAIGLLQLEQA